MAFSSFSRQGGHPPPLAEINTTPLVDVMLVLLVIFLITAPVLQQAVVLDLPQASAAPLPAPPRVVRVALNAGGQVFWDDAPLPHEQLAAKLAAVAADQPELHLRADRHTPYEAVAGLIACAQQAGLVKIAFVTEPAP
ncbi:ExbD/TolR family protein [Rivihabitans pingtungensis]|jgi:biopolymer transport protein ExbD|uniref:ExbD/TolR family protein n=1 Tax=Rivihabitans pingtungensis TaxID=1054498 RepID=UPI002B9D7D18|nr:biopolymer transporter ExbD [Rivihabitans pingtungensis]HNX71892.1 biopolymer transporter ExbD [Rivihabitans pingtungensis]